MRTPSTAACSETEIASASCITLGRQARRRTDSGSGANILRGGGGVKFVAMNSKQASRRLRRAEFPR